ncbi:hypothetical protein [Rhizobium lentis]|uniref:hypothetical protein n=1 Tax=Rhizobium lentis TaxID=1138194 RepID=UPI001C833B36|nr:hypothetical protein [Rhizobium lentis]MBX4972152.1 hypothetical protein [Rhizobium lentis]MBX4984327.1 hypothetical protein [Rhizobium lentis]MBX5027570.1 hypothetical protein [Rhizobium lentis]
MAANAESRRNRSAQAEGSMTKFIDITPGQWVLAFNEPYGPYSSEMPEHLAMFCQRGGGWDSHRAEEIFHVYQVTEVKPKTYFIGESVTLPHAYLKTRQPRTHVIAGGLAKDEMIVLRDRFFAIGNETDDRIEAEMYRRIKKYSAKEYAKAEAKIHRLLPHHFRSDP